MKHKSKKLLLAILVTAFLFKNTANCYLDIDAEVTKSTKDSSAKYKVEESVMIPLLYKDKNLLFADVRQSMYNGENIGASIGFGIRNQMGDQQIIGLYGFYDYFTSERRNAFHQIMFGAEAMFSNIEARVNSYMPVSTYEHGSLTVNPNSIVKVDSAGAPSVSTKLESEVAMRGIDGELGYKLGKTGLTLYAGGYYFARDGYDTVAGPRVRAKWSQEFFNSVTFGLSGFFQKDKIRENQFGLAVDIQIPFTQKQKSCMSENNLCVLSKKIERVSGVTAIINYKLNDNQPVNVIAQSGARTRKVNILEANTSRKLEDEISNFGENELIVIDGSGGDITVTKTIAMKSGQTIQSANKPVKLAIGDVYFDGQIDIKGARQNTEDIKTKIIAGAGFEQNTH